MRPRSSALDTSESKTRRSSALVCASASSSRRDSSQVTSWGRGKSPGSTRLPIINSSALRLPYRPGTPGCGSGSLSADGRTEAVRSSLAGIGAMMTCSSSDDEESSTSSCQAESPVASHVVPAMTGNCEESSSRILSPMLNFTMRRLLGRSTYSTFCLPAFLGIRLHAE